MNLTGIRGIGSRAFENCERLESVVIPASVVNIGYDAFSNCTDLKRVSLPKGLKGKVDEERVFCYCHDDLKITYRDESAPAKKPTAKKADKKTAKKK